jgi:S1/P1 Nuclease
MMRRFQIVIACFCGVAVFTIGAGSAVAWNSPGHMIIALVAYEQLDDATRTAAVELLRAHPRFHDHFESAMPREVRRGNHREQDRWIFAQAATWPDLVRDTKREGRSEASGIVNREDVREYSRPWWHFIDEPIYLDDEARRQIEHHLRVNLDRKPLQGPDDPDMNIIQAVKNSTRIVGDSTGENKTRAVHLCWILHLVGDSHQPLHSCALYSMRRFPDGDHGGNYLEIEHGWKLHGFWDDQIANDESYETLVRSAAALNQNRERVAEGKKAAGSLDVDRWVDESFDLAKRQAYTKEVLEKVANREGHTHLAPLDLSASYKANAENVAERRAAEAGFRLAALLKQILK